ncbi:MAG: ATP-binding protein [Bacteroidetes bacterium]|nr:ATP-binding protein [Bacteroidota bacterium]
MIKIRSIRNRLTAWYALGLGMTLLITGVSATFVTRAALIENLDESLHNEVRWVNDFIEPKAKRVRLKRAAILELRELRKTAAQQPAPPGDSLAVDDETDAMWREIYRHTLLTPRSHYIQILDRNGDLLYASQTLGTKRLDWPQMPYKWIRVVTSTMPGGEEIRMAVTQNDYVKIYVGYPLQSVNEVLDSLFVAFRYFAPLAFLISVIGGWFLAHKSLKPVDEITTAVREITAQNLTRRLPPARVDDELGRLSAQFNDMIGRLQSSFAQVQQFSADASHELRTPLTIMRGEVDVALRGKRLSAETRELLSSLRDELVRLSSIVEGLMSLVRSDVGRHALDLSEVPLHELLTQLLEDAKMLAAPQRITVTFDPVEPIAVVGDPLRLRQLFLNLIDNAVKYTPDGGAVRLSLTRRGGQAVIAVSDTGIGIPADEQPRIFDRFHRVLREGRESPPGSGLGLSIAKWIAEAHNGSIEVESTVGGGSTFRVILPPTSSVS